MLLGFSCGYVLARRRAVIANIKASHIDNLVLILLLAGPAGARWFARLFYLPNVSFWESFKLWESGGLVFYGGVVAGILALVIYGAVAKLPLLRLADLFAAPLAVGLGFGRIGCFMAGCCWGDICVDQPQLAGLDPSVQYQVQTIPVLSAASFPLKVSFPKKSLAFEQHQKLKLVTASANRSLPVHPVQLYEATLAFLLALMLDRVFRKQVAAGQTAVALVIGYAVIRFMMEFFRADNDPRFHGLTISQVISLCFLCAGIVLWMQRKRLQVAAAPRCSETLCKELS